MDSVDCENLETLHSSIQPCKATDDSQNIQSCVYCEELLILLTMIDIKAFYDLNSPEVS